MGRSVYVVVWVCLALLASGCRRSADVSAEEQPFLVNLDLNVALSDIAIPRYGNGAVEWQVDVVPYDEVLLEPGFGI